MTSLGAQDLAWTLHTAGASPAQDWYISEPPSSSSEPEKSEVKKTAHVEVWVSVALHEWFPLPACADVLIRSVEHTIHVAAAVSLRGGDV